MLTYNERLEELKQRKKVLEEEFRVAVIAFEEAMKVKGGPGPNVWDDELASLSDKRIRVFQSLKELDKERDHLIREAHAAAQKAIREIGADKIVSTGCTWRDALEF